ncbi:MAG TPA: restriction endonuclease [Candidatus Atribacteria bacterium]|nr:restriction endonuclease [Candidatus Atribacteria bacterium]
MSGYEFEGFLKKLFQRRGYQVVHTKLSKDQGADLIIKKFGEKTAVQAKRYSGTIGNKAVREVLGAISLYKCQKGMVVATSNKFSKEARELAKENHIELIGRTRLREWIEKYW